MLEDFTCEAIPGPNASRPAHAVRGVASGMHVLEEVMARASQSSLPDGRLAELRSLSSAQLLSLVLLSGLELDREDMLAIHDIAIERLGRGQGPFFEESLKLSREVMLAAIGNRD